MTGIGVEGQVGVSSAEDKTAGPICETRSGLATAAVYLAGLAIGLVFGPLGCGLADRWNLRITLVAANLLQVAALSPLLFVDSERIWPVYVVVVLQGLISNVNDPASFVLLPRLVRDEQLVRANSAVSAASCRQSERQALDSERWQPTLTWNIHRSNPVQRPERNPSGRRASETT